MRENRKEGEIERGQRRVGRLREDREEWVDLYSTDKRVKRDRDQIREGIWIEFR